VPVFLDVSDATLSDVITRANKAVVRAARFGQYPPHDLAAHRRAIELDRGVAFDLSCWLNYRTLATRRPTTDIPSPAALATAAERTRWRWINAVDSSTSTYFIFADDAGDLLRLTLLHDTALLPSDEALARLRGLERLLCAAVSHDLALPDAGDHTGLTPATYSPEWTLTEAGWTHRPAVTTLLRHAANTHHADVFATPEGLVAYLASETDPHRLHTTLVDALPGHRNAVAPHHYVVCATPPPTPDLTAWQRLPVLVQGSGRG